MIRPVPSVYLGVASETVEDAEAPIRDLVLPGLINGVALWVGKNYDYLAVRATIGTIHGFLLGGGRDEKDQFE
jgi:hypothetical protein